MELNTSNTTTYESSRAVEGAAPAASQDAHDRINLHELPKLLWAGSFLFIANVILAGTMAVSPQLKVTAFGAEQDQVPGNKPSPFELVVNESKARKVRTAVRMTPASYEFITPQDELTKITAPVVPAFLDQPRSTETAQVQRISYSITDREEGTKSYNVNLTNQSPTSISERTSQAGSPEVAPRRASERSIRTLIN